MLPPDNQFRRWSNSFEVSSFFCKMGLSSANTRLSSYVERIVCGKPSSSTMNFLVSRPTRRGRVAQIADSRVLGLIQQILTAGYDEKDQKFPTARRTPQAGIISHLLSNVLLSRKTSNKWSYQARDHARFAATRALRCQMWTPIVARFVGD